MPTLSIDNQTVTVDQGTTILEAAQAIGITIPTLCHYGDCTGQNSCLVCSVRINGQEKMVPSCSQLAGDGMVVDSQSEAVQAARRTALELLSSDHAGDCIAPCQLACPAHMNVPLMIRQIIAGDLQSAIETVRRDIPLPAVLGRICSAPCEGACRQGQASGTVAICLLRRFVADHDMASDNPYVPPCRPPTGKRIAILGTGATGLAAAYFLQQAGHDCTLVDQYDQPGGPLRYDVSQDILPHNVLDAEIEIIRQMGATFLTKGLSAEHPDLSELRRQYDAVLVGTSQLDRHQVQQLGVEASDRGIVIDKATYQTNVPGVFACGSAVRKTKLAVANIADARAAATCLGQLLDGTNIAAPQRPFTIRMGRLAPDELARFIAASGASQSERTTPAGGLVQGFTPAEAIAEAKRCLNCDCQVADDCRLRDCAAACHVKPGRYRGERRRFAVERRPSDVAFETGKCIACGLCVQIAQQAGEPLGVTFVGRGFDVRVEVPFGGSVDQGLGSVAARCVEACPTGALTFAQTPPPKPDQ